MIDQTDAAVQARRREIAAEHVLFKTIEYVERRHPGLLDYIEGSLDLIYPSLPAPRDQGSHVSAQFAALYREKQQSLHATRGQLERVTSSVTSWSSRGS